MDLGSADAAAETAGAPAVMLFLGGDVTHPATRAGKLLSRPDAVGHRSKPADAAPLFGLAYPNRYPADLSKTLIGPRPNG